MTHHRRRQLLCVTWAVVVGAVALWSLGHRLLTPASVLTPGALILLVAAALAGRSHRPVLGGHRRARRTALIDTPRAAPARLCRSFRRAPEGAAHGPGRARGRRAAGDATRAWQDLHDACCLRGWESRGAVHDPGGCVRRASA
ncbi:hypothetical protein [Streptomyces sp. NPDC046197]|uniref:hypothetical protein n=1 Tax=Streptomyces sp. NPDC046197 TaxID=3154337 RepID=UPI0033C71C7B